jgi:nitrilase
MHPQAAGKAHHRRGAMPAFPAHLCSSTTTEISSMANILRVAACHASPVFLNARKTTENAISFIKQAASRKANLIVFPETYIAAFPIWSALRPPTENHALFQHMVQESMYADGAEIEAIREAAKSSGVLISIGSSEKSRNSNGCLYNSNLTIGVEREVLVHHRKLVPTFFEKLTWSPGDGHGLRVASTPFGRIGTFICGENTNALARYSLIAQAEQVHVSTWPAVWLTRTSQTSSETNTKERPSTVLRANGTNYDNLAANKTRAAAHCFEVKCFGVACSGHLGEDAIEAIIHGSRQPDIIASILRAIPRAATFFLDPTGAPLPSFIYRGAEKEYVDALQNDEGILYADMNLDDCMEGKQYHDVVVGYQRLDVFDLEVDRSRKEPVHFT